MTKDEAIKKLQKFDFIGSNEDIEFLTALEMAIDALKDGWIKCTENMELPDHEVLVCDKYGEEMIGWLFKDAGSNTTISAESEHEYCYDVVAYMEKPKPPEGD